MVVLLVATKAVDSVDIVVERRGVLKAAKSVDTMVVLLVATKAVDSVALVVVSMACGKADWLADL